MYFSGYLCVLPVGKVTDRDVDGRDGAHSPVILQDLDIPLELTLVSDIGKRTAFITKIGVWLWWLVITRYFRLGRSKRIRSLQMTRTDALAMILLFSGTGHRSRLCQRLSTLQGGNVRGQRNVARERLQLVD